MTAQLAPSPVFRSWDNVGFPLVGGQLYTYAAGTTAFQATYVDSTQTIQNANPVVLNFRGEAFVWLNPLLAYKFMLYDALGNLIWSEDNIQGAIGIGQNIVPSQSNTFTLGTSTISFANGYFGPNAVPIYDAASGNIGYYARTSAEITAEVIPSDYAYMPGDVRRYGVDLTGTMDCTTAVNSALKSFAQVVLPPGTYKIDGSANGGVITIPANTSLWALPGTVTFNVTGNNGVTAVASSPFQLTHHSSVVGLNIVYPNQTLADLVADIIQYPPTFTINPTNNASYGGYCHIRDITCTGSYILSSVQGVFYECFWERIVSYVTLFKGLDFSGSVQMGDTSRASDCQIVMTGSAGFNDPIGPVSQWCQSNSIGVSAVCTGSNRIDGFMLSNFNVIGGSLAYSIGTNCWFQGVNISADSVTQALWVNSTSAQFYADEMWCSLQLQYYGLREVPALRCTGGILRICDAEVSMQQANSQNALFIDSGTVELEAIRFVTSRGGFAPVIYSAAGAVKANGCTVQASVLTSGIPRPLAWRDVCVGSVSGAATPQFSIDGKNAVVAGAGALALTNFNMATWVSGVPSSWTTTEGTPANFFQNLQPVDGNIGIEFASGSNTGSYSLSYQLPAGDDDLFGYYLFVCGIQVIDPGGTSAPATIFNISMTDGSGSNLYTVDLAWSGALAETVAIPTSAYYPLVMMLCAPVGTALGKFNFNVNCQTSTNLTIRIKGMGLYGMAPAPECTGQEYWNAQTGGRPRDIQLGPNKRLFRAAAPTGGTWALGDVAVNNASPAAGTTEWRCTAAGAPGTWTGLTIP
jgi:hypothetical protein